MDLLSIVIPSHKDVYLHKTIDSILDNAKGNIEVIPVLDGYEPAKEIVNDPRVKPVKHGKNMGMRESINTGVAAANGKYLMRTDEHCMFSHGFDVIALSDMQDNWIQVGRRYFLDPIKWEIMPEKGYIDYEKLIILRKPHKGIEKFSAVAWSRRTKERADIMVDETMAFQGSVWIMPSSWWHSVIHRLDSFGYGTHYQDTTEMLFKTWAKGGKLMLNKRWWYAHKERLFNRTHQYPIEKAIPEFKYALMKHREEYEQVRSKWQI